MFLQIGKQVIIIWCQSEEHGGWHLTLNVHSNITACLTFPCSCVTMTLLKHQTRSTQRTQTSAKRQHNRIAEWFLQGICSVCWQRGSSSRIMIRNGLPDPDSDADRHQNVISWSLGHTPALHRISSKSVGNFFDNPVNADLGLRTPGSGRWSGSSPKLNSLVSEPYPTPPRNFVKIHSQLFQLSDRQTDRQTEVKT